jgi:thymidylate synthase
MTQELLGEASYLHLLNQVYTTGRERQTRNSITKSIFGGRLEFDLTQGFPLLTTKKTFFKGIATELLFFLTGKTDNTVLQKQGVHIWDGNSSKEYLKSRNLEYPEGILGPIYGRQWRRFNCEYKVENNREDNINDIPMSSPKQDQLAEIIRLIKEDPMSRRMLMSGWNPAQHDMMALEPCHVLYQFYVDIRDGVKYLSCQMYQRSADIFLGLPFNIASTALLTHIIANITDCQVDKLYIVVGDVHIYDNHYEQVKTQLERTPYPFPTITLPTGMTLENLDTYDWKNFIINNYVSHPAIKAEMKA